MAGLQCNTSRHRGHSLFTPLTPISHTHTSGKKKNNTKHKIKGNSTPEWVSNLTARGFEPVWNHPDTVNCTVWWSILLHLCWRLMRKKKEENRATATQPKCYNRVPTKCSHYGEKKRGRENPSEHLMDGSILYREVAKSNPLALCDVHTAENELKIHITRTSSSRFEKTMQAAATDTYKPTWIYYSLAHQHL